jgi:hypothetical protein
MDDALRLQARVSQMDFAAQATRIAHVLARDSSPPNVLLFHKTEADEIGTCIAAEQAQSAADVRPPLNGKALTNMRKFLKRVLLLLTFLSTVHFSGERKSVPFTRAEIVELVEADRAP